MTEYGRIHTDGSRSGGQPMTDEAKPVEVTPPEDLRPWGWAAGHYWINCCDCPEETKFNGVGAKRCYRCREHAIAAWRASLATLPTPSSDMVEAMARAVFPILWKAECYNGITLRDVDDCRIGGKLNMGGRVERYEAQATEIAQAAATMIAEAMAAKDAEHSAECEALGNEIERMRDYSTAKDAELAELRAEIEALRGHKVRLERAVIRAAAPDLLTQEERAALKDFIAFLRDEGDSTVCAALGSAEG